MQKDWARRYEFVALDEATLNAMLQPVFPGKKVVEATLLTAGLCNTNYKIKLSDLDDAFVLRLYIRERAACQKDYDIFKLVQGNVPVPELLYIDSEGSHYDVAYSVMKWVDGVLLSDIIATGNPAKDCAYSVGQTLAAIGTYTFPHAGFFGPGLAIAQPFDDANSPFLSIIEQFLYKENTGQRLGNELRDRLWQFVTTNAHYLDITRGSASLVHSDFKSVNILVKDKHISAVLDWEFAFASSPLIDIANMLRYEHLLPDGFVAQFLHGYQDRGGQLSTGWHRASKLLDLISLCEFLNAPHANNALIAEVTGLILGTMTHWHKYDE